jgi:hypothetical protein
VAQAIQFFLSIKIPLPIAKSIIFHTTITIAKKVNKLFEIPVESFGWYMASIFPIPTIVFFSYLVRDHIM